MFSEENQQEKLAKAMSLAGLAMMDLGAQIMQFNQKETTVNILLSLKPDADIKQIASVILTMKSMLIAVGASIVKLYHPLEGQSNPKCFRVLELNQYSIDIEKSLVQNQSDNIDSQHYPKLLTVDARPKKIQDQPSQINSETKELLISNNRYTQMKNKLILALLIAFLGTFLSFYYKAAIDRNKDLVITTEIRLDSIKSTQSDTYQDVQAEVKELENIISDLSSIENKPFFYYPKAQNLIELAQDIKLEKEKTLEPLRFDQALKSAYDVAVLTQTAKTVADWTQVQQGWKSAIDQFASIPESSEKYEQAQQKLGEYQANLSYAEQKLASAKEFSEPVSIVLKVEKTSDNRAGIVGETNLPDGSEILLSMRSNLGSEAQDKVIISNGKFSTTLGSETGLVTAKYTVDAIFSPFSQSDDVRAIVGSKGEKLKGELVSESTVIEGMKLASSLPVEFNVGDQSVISKTEDDNNQLARGIYNEVQNLINQAKAMQPLRESSNLQDQAQCTVRMRELQSQVKTLDQKAQALSQKYLFLKVSIENMKIGVTCDAEITPGFISEAEGNLRQVSQLF